MSPKRKKITLIDSNIFNAIKKITLVFFFAGFLFSLDMNAQQRDSLLKGYVSFVSSKNTYVKFESTKEIKNGDTLYIKQAVGLIPALIVINRSSTSCVGTLIKDIKIEQSVEIYFPFKYTESKELIKKETYADNPFKASELKTESRTIKPVVIKEKNNDWKGRFSMASYSNFSNILDKPSHRLNYTLSLTGNRIGSSALSFESYISFRHKIDEWYRVKENINDALKIYSFAIKYSFPNNFDVYLGRRINYRLSSMGSIDGIQLEKSFHNFVIGAVCGSRPDLNDYSLNMKLFQTGAFVGYNFDAGNKISSQNTLAVVEQMNHGETDRRFLHFQHSSILFNNLSIFSSLEFDMYKKINDVKSNNIRLTNIYLTMRYRISKKLSISGSYDARSNIIYYETYKNKLDQLLEEATRQGFRLQFNYQPFRLVSFGCSGNLRFQQDKQNESKNVNAYVSYSKVPWLNFAVNITSNYLQTQYLESKSIGITLSRDIINSSLYGELYFRLADYQYANLENIFGDKMYGFNLSYRINKNASLNLYSEETFEQSSRYLNVNLRAMLRF